MKRLKSEESPEASTPPFLGVATIAQIASGRTTRCRWGGCEPIESDSPAALDI